MFYLISEEDLENLLNNTEDIKSLTKPEKIALITWSGEDVIEYIKKHANCSESMIEEVIKDVKKYLENCDCAQCFRYSIEAILKERGYYNER